jgi:glycosyltransferase involved in cell wall biosynthesis
MKVLYDYQAFSMQRYGGVSKCFCELLKAFGNGIDYEILLNKTNNAHLRESNLCKSTVGGFDYFSFLPNVSFKGKKRLYLTLEKLGIIRTIENENLSYAKEHLAKCDFDVFHPTFYNPYFLDHIGDKPFVLTIHDMMPELFPQYYRQDDPQIVWKKKLSAKASHIVAVSENTKQDIVRLLNIDPQKISVIYHGGPEVSSNIPQRKEDTSYFLFVGMRNGYKNFFHTLNEFDKFSKVHKDYKLICVGMPFEKNEKDYIHSRGLDDKVLCVRANDTELVSYYAYASAFVYPSLYEGFGMPILEAFAAGCPVILNNASCFPEIAGDSAIYFDGHNGSSLYDAMTRICNMSERERNSLVESGYERLKLFSWAESAQRLASIYKSLI